MCDVVFVTRHMFPDKLIIPLLTLFACKYYFIRRFGLNARGGFETS